MSFKVGDRVRRINTSIADVSVLSQGVVVCISTFDESSKVQFDGTTQPYWNDNVNLELVQKKISPTLSTKPSNPKDRAATHRVDLTLFPETARVFGAVAMTEGDCKYGAYNYRSVGVRLSTYVAALNRHIGKYYDKGEWADEKTGVPHLANALACIAVLIDGHVAGNIVDDRPPKIQGDLYVWAESLTKKLHEIFPQGPERFTHTQGEVNGSVPDWLTEES